MRKSIYHYALLLAMPVMVIMSACEPRALTQDQLFLQPDTTQAAKDALDKILLAENPVWGYRFYDLNDFLDTFMRKEEGNWLNDTMFYRTRATNGNGFYVFSIDTIPTDTIGIYIRGRVSTDDFAGNFYKSFVIQQIVNGEQQNLRISVDMGSIGGTYQLGQELIIRCNGLSIGRYANQPQLCIPTYDNNINKINEKKKVGWCPGRIPAAMFHHAVHFIGTPEPSLLKYDTLTLTQLYNLVPEKPAISKEGMDQVRKADGRLIVLKDVRFTGQANDDGTITDCVYMHPDSSTIVNVFASTTNNIGFPQSRVLSDNAGKKFICCQSSEYSKYAYYFIPGAKADTKDPVAECKSKRWLGTVTGILGWYMDDASDMTASTMDWKQWSVCPRGIPGIGIPDIYMKNTRNGKVWVPVEFDPEEYNQLTSGQ